MEKDKHVLPELNDTFSERIKRGVGKTNMSYKTIYGPDNTPLTKVDVEVGKELTGKIRS